MLKEKFELNEKEKKKAKEFIEEQRKKSKENGTIYDRFVYKFSPTSIGTSVKIIDEYLDDEKLLTDMSNW